MAKGPVVRDGMRRVRTPGMKFEGKGRTKQEFAKDCDINLIMEKYKRTGMIEHVKRYEGSYGSFLGGQDFQTAMFAVAQAREMFESLPAETRARFGNDPAAFLHFVEDEKNIDEMRELGLLEVPPEIPPEKPVEPSISPERDAANHPPPDDGSEAPESSQER